MNVRQANTEDTDGILLIIDEARSIMRDNGNLTQWSNGYPSREIILNDIRQNQAFIIEEKEMLGYFCFMNGDNPDPNYEVIKDGAWLNDKPYGVIHRLASGRKAKGIARVAFDFAFSGISNIRVDTHHDNMPMQNFLKKLDFTHCGIIYVNDGTPRDAFQKQL